MKKNEISLKKVLLNSGIYSFTSILQKGVGFLLLPLYTLYLTPEDYGITGLVNSFTSVLTLLFTVSLNGAVQRYYYIYKDNNKKLKSFFGTIISFVMFNSIILSIIIIMFQRWIVTPFIDGVAFSPYILIGIFTVIFSPVYIIYQSLLQTMQKGKKFAQNSLLHFGMIITLNIIFIVFFKWGAMGQLLSYLFTSVIFGIFSLYSLYKEEVISFDFNLTYLREALRYSVPLLPHALSSSIATFISRLFLNNLVSTGSAGLFNVSSQFLMLVDTLQMSANNAYIPWFYGEMNKGKKSHKNISEFADILSKGYLIISVAMSFVIKEVIQFFLPDEYLVAWTLVPIMLIAYQFKSIYLFHVNTLFYNTKSTKYIFIASLSGNLVYIMISSIFTSRLGLITPAIGMLVQWIITSIIVILLSRKIEPVNFNLKKMISYVLIMTLTIVLGQFYDLLNPIANLSLGNSIHKLIVFLLFFLSITYKDLPVLRNKITILINNFRKEG